MILLLWLLALLGLSPAHAGELRKISLNDGRVLLATIEETRADGLLVALPQGQMLVPFESVAQFDPLTQAEYDAQPAWRIVLPPFASPLDPAASKAEAVRAALLDMLAMNPGLEAKSSDEFAAPVPADKVKALAACGTSAACAGPLLGPVGADAVLLGHVTLSPGSAGVQVSFTSAFAGAPLASRTVSPSAEIADPEFNRLLLEAAREALSLLPSASLASAVEAERARTVTSAAAAVSTGKRPTAPAPAPPGEAAAPAPVEPPAVASAPPKADAPKQAQLRAMAWIPLPGAPSLARQDWAGLGLSWAVAAPGTAALVAVAGQSAFTRAQLITLGAASGYLMTVAANHLFGLRGLPPMGVSVTPLPGGGGVLTVSAAR